MMQAVAAFGTTYTPLQAPHMRLEQRTALHHFSCGADLPTALRTTKLPEVGGMSEHNSSMLLLPAAMAT
jgi:hypothetical protein